MPRNQKYAVDLSADERAELNAMLASGTHKSRLHDLFVDSNAEFLFAHEYDPLQTACTKCTAF